MADTERYDIIIAGAGLSGAAFALAAAQAGLKVVLVDPQPFSAQLAPTFDGRSTAVAFSTFRMLDALGLGQSLRPHACRMDHILVTDGRRPGAASRSASPAFLRFDADEIGGRTGGEPRFVRVRRVQRGVPDDEGGNDARGDGAPHQLTHASDRAAGRFGGSLSLSLIRDPRTHTMARWCAVSTNLCDKQRY